MSNSRWRVACHEAGHAVAAIVLGGKCNGATLYFDQSGQCEIDELLPTRLAYAVAAGPNSEYLAAEYPAPDVAYSTTIPTDDDVQKLPIFETAPVLALYLARGAKRRTHGADDDRVIAEWAISCHEGEPDSWAQRVDQCKRIAAEIVTHNAARIVRVAEALYIRGSLSRDEITALFQGE